MFFKIPSNRSHSRISTQQVLSVSRSYSPLARAQDPGAAAGAARPQQSQSRDLAGTRCSELSPGREGTHKGCPLLELLSCCQAPHLVALSLLLFHLLQFHLLFLFRLFLFLLLFVIVVILLLLLFLLILLTLFTYRETTAISWERADTAEICPSSSAAWFPSSSAPGAEHHLGPRPAAWPAVSASPGGCSLPPAPSRRARGVGAATHQGNNQLQGGTAWH